MRYNQLGNTDLHLSSIGLGTYAIGGGNYKFGWGPQDDKASIATIHRAMELGINWLDTAPVYGDGHSESIVGQAIRGKRDKIFISTKCGLGLNQTKDNFVFNLKQEHIRAEAEASLKRLQTEVIDLYQIHRPIPEEDVAEAWNTLHQLVKEGKVRYAGVSAFSIEQLKAIQSVYPVSFLQPQYNMLERSIEKDLMGYCSSNNIGIISYSTMATGLLTGTFSKEKFRSLPADDLRHLLPDFQEPCLSANIQLIEKLRGIAEDNNRTVSQLAIAWVLRRPEITSAIVGARNPAQIEQTAPAGDWVLAEQLKGNLDKLLEEHHAHLKEIRAQ
jgi:aryl-alcohol dehydrogenase-like predicted oxidoreductase